MNAEKSILESKTMWGLVLAVVYPWLAKHGYTGGVDALSTDVIAAVGLVLSVYGRFTANAPLTLTK